MMTIEGISMDDLTPQRKQTLCRLLRAAYNYAMITSDDPSTKLGALLFSAGHGSTVVQGSNHLMRGVPATKENLQRPRKYDVMVHAERSVIYTAASIGVKTTGLTMVVPWATCVPCAQAIVESGIVTVVTHKSMMDRTPERWESVVTDGLSLLRRAGVEHISIDADLGECSALMDGKNWKP